MIDQRTGRSLVGSGRRRPRRHDRGGGAARGRSHRRCSARRRRTGRRPVGRRTRRPGGAAAAGAAAVRRRQATAADRRGRRRPVAATVRQRHCSGPQSAERHIRGVRMSIPRFAIQRPVMMTMLSCIIILLGGISLTRLPVDLLPDISQPTINVRVNYAGVGPLEMEELITRPLEQQLSAVVGPRADELELERRQHQHPAELHLGHRPQRGDGRHPHAHRPRARPAARGRRAAGHSEVRLERGADHGPRRRERRRQRSIASRCASWPRTCCRRGSSACRASPR